MNNHFKSSLPSQCVSLQVAERTEDKASSRGHRGAAETRREQKLPFQTTAQRPTQLSTFTSMLTHEVHIPACTHKLMPMAADHGGTQRFWNVYCT